MKRFTPPVLAVLTILASAALAARADMMGRDEDRSSRREHAPRAQQPRPSGRSSQPSVVYRRRRVSVPRPDAPAPRDRPAHNRVIPYPKRDDAGREIAKPAATAPPPHHAEVTRDPDVVRGIKRQQRDEREPNHHYWHTEKGVRYSHYYDGRVHWYGFYHGPTFYWTRYNAGRWWWFDIRASRWVYWWDGFWWWPGPDATYVYVDNNYYPYEGEGVTVQNAVVQTPPAAAPAAGAGTDTAAPDGRRLVRVFGADAQAFLFDATAAPPAFMKYLGQGVSQVRFSGGAPGKPPQILLQFKDGTYALFDEDGNSQSAAVLSAASQTAPPADVPGDIPPPPTDAPGQ